MLKIIYAMKPYPRSLWIGSVAVLAVCYLAFAESPNEDRPLQAFGPAALPTLEEAQFGDAPFVQPELNRNTEVRIRKDVDLKDVNQQLIQAGEHQNLNVGPQAKASPAVQRQKASQHRAAPRPKQSVKAAGSLTKRNATTTVHSASSAHLASSLHAERKVKSTVHRSAGVRASGTLLVHHAPVQHLPMRQTAPKVHPVSRHSTVSSRPAPYHRSHGLVLRPEAVAAFETVQKESSDTSTDLEPLGHFTVTAYALSVQSTGKSPGMPGFGIPASGSHAHVGRTVAVDPTVIPIGSLIFIDLPGVGWRLAEDTGGAIKGHHIDLLLPSDSKALKFGIKHGVKVYAMSR